MRSRCAGTSLCRQGCGPRLSPARSTPTTFGHIAQTRADDPRPRRYGSSAGNGRAHPSDMPHEQRFPVFRSLAGLLSAFGPMSPLTMRGLKGQQKVKIGRSGWRAGGQGQMHNVLLPDRSSAQVIVEMAARGESHRRRRCCSASVRHRSWAVGRRVLKAQLGASITFRQLAAGAVLRLAMIGENASLHQKTVRKPPHSSETGDSCRRTQRSEHRE